MSDAIPLAFAKRRNTSLNGALGGSRRKRYSLPIRQSSKRQRSAKVQVSIAQHRAASSSASFAHSASTRSYSSCSSSVLALTPTSRREVSTIATIEGRTGALWPNEANWAAERNIEGNPNAPVADALQRIGARFSHRLCLR
jgi:hypothetical protein